MTSATSAFGGREWAVRLGELCRCQDDAGHVTWDQLEDGSGGLDEHGKYLLAAPRIVGMVDSVEDELAELDGVVGMDDDASFDGDVGPGFVRVDDRESASSVSQERPSLVSLERRGEEQPVVATGKRHHRCGWCPIQANRCQQRGDAAGNEGVLN